MSLLSKHSLHDCNQIVFGAPSVYVLLPNGGTWGTCIALHLRPDRQGLICVHGAKLVHHGLQQRTAILQGRQRQSADCSTEKDGLCIKQAVRVEALRHNDYYQCNPNAQNTFAVGIVTGSTPRPLSS